MFITGDEESAKESLLDSKPIGKIAHFYSQFTKSITEVVHGEFTQSQANLL